MRIVAAALVFAAMAGPAAAREPSAWIKCDGMPKPETVGSSLGRVLALSATMGLMGMPETERERPAAHGKAGVDACTAALQDKVLDNCWARRVNLLRARAVHQLEAGDMDAALTDLRAARDAAGAKASETAFARSLGASAQLFEAAVLAKRGQFPEAEALAIRAFEARPYSMEGVSAATRILALDPAWSPEEDRVLTRLAALDPDARFLRAEVRDWGPDRQAALDAWMAAIEGQGSGAGAPSLMLPERFLTGRAALAAARAGKGDEARALIERTRGGGAPALDAKAPSPLQAAMGAFQDAATEQGKRFATLAEAWLLADAGQTQQAVALLEKVDLPVSPAIPELLAKLKVDNVGSQGMSAEELRIQMRQRAAERLKADAYAQTLPALERTEGGNAFSKQGVLGFKPNGFKERKTKTGDGRTIEFVGGQSTRAAVEEMSLLRAAQLAREAGRPSFMVTDRRDYRQTLVTTYGGSQIGSRPQGFKTEVDVVFVDAASAPEPVRPIALDAEQVWAELSPFYVTAAPAKKR